MKTRSTLKACAILVAASLQGVLINAVCNHFGIGSKVMIAGEIPEPGSIILLTMGAIAIFRRRESK
jgi:hypothetical protein